MTNWPALRAAAGPSSAEVKERLPLEYVVGVAAGVPMERAPDGRLIGLCPFHDDERPSFDVFGDELEKCGCWSCDFGRVNDLFDFIGAYYRLETFAQRMAKACEILVEYEDTDQLAWRPSTPAPRRELEVGDLELAAVALRSNNYAQLNSLTSEKNISDAAWVAREFRLGADGDALLIPHVDRDDVVTGAKTRRFPGVPYAKPGSEFKDLYGAWRDRGQKTVVICEGETDCWRLAELTREDDVLVVSLPAGANQAIAPWWLTLINGRDVTLCLDADDAGRSATARWLAALGPGTRVAVLDDGDDVCSAPDPLTRVRQAWPLAVDLGLVQRSGAMYVSAANNAALTNWAFDATCAWFTEEGALRSFEGVLVPGNVAASLTLDDFVNMSSMRAWAGARGGSWLGNVRDLEGLLNHLTVQIPVLSRGTLVRELGLHGDTFVLPRKTVGPRRMRWDGGGAEGVIGDKCVQAETGPILRGEALRVGLEQLLAIRESEVIRPLVAWLCAAHLRGTVREFPALAVTGGSGHGKTTVVAHLLWSFGYQTGFTVPDLTPYAVQRLVGASHGVPLWFDEYRRDVRADTVQALEGALRAAWGRQAGAKGGMKERWAELTELPASSPLIVTGEESLIEQSLTDRSAIIALPPWQGRAGVVRAPSLVGPAFTWWLTACARDGCLPEREMAVDRGALTLSTLRWGWEIFMRFAMSEAFTDVGELNLDLISGEQGSQRVAQELEVLAWGLTQRAEDGISACWVDEGGRLVVRVQELLSLVRRRSDFVLPGGSRWFAGVLRDRYGARAFRVGQYRVMEMSCPDELK